MHILYKDICEIQSVQIWGYHGNVYTKLQSTCVSITNIDNLIINSKT